MVFAEGSPELFLKYFRESAPQIRAFPGCRSLRLLRDKEDPHIFFTYSQWETPADLETYRNSPLFATTWARVKPLFQEKAQAWSVDEIWHDEG